MTKNCSSHKRSLLYWFKPLQNYSLRLDFSKVMMTFQLLWTRFSHRTSDRKCLRRGYKAWHSKYIINQPQNNRDNLFCVCTTPSAVDAGLCHSPRDIPEIIIHNSSANKENCPTSGTWNLVTTFLWMSPNHSTATPQALLYILHCFGLQGTTDVTYSILFYILLM